MIKTISADDNTWNGRCSQCGRCCSNLLPMSRAEIRKIKRYIAKEHVSVPNKRSYQIVDDCPFRDNVKKKCVIYPVRPMICRDYQCDKFMRGQAADLSLYRGEYRIEIMSEVFAAAIGGKASYDEQRGNQSVSADGRRGVLGRKAL